MKRKAKITNVRSSKPKSPVSIVVFPDKKEPVTKRKPIRKHRTEGKRKHRRKGNIRSSQPPAVSKQMDTNWYSFETPPAETVFSGLNYETCSGLNYKTIKPQKETIAVLCSHQSIVKGLSSAVSTEARIVLNIAWMLAREGHPVDFMGAAFKSTHAHKGLDIVIPANDPISPTLPNLKYFHGPKEGGVKGKYDVCVTDMTTGKYAFQYINADKYIFVTHFPSLMKSFEQQFKSFNKPFKICMIRSQYHEYFPHLTEFPILPFPIPVLSHSGNSFNRKNIFWTTKHIISEAHKPEPGSQGEQMMHSSWKLLDAIIPYRSKGYSFEFVVPTGGQGSGFQDRTHHLTNKYRYAGLYYNEVIQIASKSKLSINCYYAGSFYECMLNGCLPIVWKASPNEWVKGGLPFLKQAAKYDCLFFLDDDDTEIRRKINKLMTDEAYYNEVFDAFMSEVSHHDMNKVYPVFWDIARSI